ncbi:MAG: GxxExxY protein [Candidatus Kapabacteria bacterium]|nr:GxxExxY protein [Candidatus Kapabacteria bacterium]
MTENEIATIIVDIGFHIHKDIGCGLYEKVYQIVMCDELERRGLSFQSEVDVPIVYKERTIERAFRADIIVEDKVIIELKSLAEISDVHRKQLHTYLKLSDRKLGLLINFGSILYKNGVERIVNNL